LQLRYADALARVDRLDESVTVLRDMVEREPDDPTYLNALGFTLADAGKNLDEAEVYLRHAYRVASDEGFIVDSLGWLLHQRGNDEGAERLLQRALRQSPQDAEVLWHLGEVVKARGKREDARVLFVKALAAHPPKQLKTRIQQSMTRA
jgi:Flp pilus assembly protein TadD